MASNGEIYHLAFNLHEELMKKGMQVTTVEIRDYLTVLNGQGMSLPDMEKKAREAAMEIHNKKISARKMPG
jgi:dihydroxyacetone kinase